MDERIEYVAEALGPLDNPCVPANECYSECIESAIGRMVSYAEAAVRALDEYDNAHCYCGSPLALGVVHREDGPCHLPIDGADLREFIARTERQRDEYREQWQLIAEMYEGLRRAVLTLMDGDPLGNLPHAGECIYWEPQEPHEALRCDCNVSMLTHQVEWEAEAPPASEVENLRRWKAEATAALAEWDAVHDALGSPAALGERKSAASLREVERLDRDGRAVAGRCLHYEARANEAEAAIARVEALCDEARSRAGKAAEVYPQMGVETPTVDGLLSERQVRAAMRGES